MGGVAWRGRRGFALVIVRLSLSVAALALGQACSLEGLDRFPFPSCGADGLGCNVLNARDGIADTACMRWQCAPTTGDCTFGLRDLDGDTFVALECGGTDCQDDTADAHPGAAESCDGADNDCNGVVDDVGASAMATTPMSVVTGTSGPTFLQMSDAADGFYAVWNAAGQTRNALVTQIASETPSTILLGHTNANPDRGLFESDALSGCPSTLAIDLLPTPCPASGTCPGSQICATALDGSMNCEQPVLHHLPSQLANECQTHADCSDGIACNGLEQCEPRSDPSLFVSNPNGLMGCRRGNTTPCATMGSCDEGLHACVMPLVNACDFRDIGASWAGGGELMTAALSLDGCTMGRLRVGLVATTDDPPSDILWGGSALSTTWAGVDLDDAGCTGASRPSGDPAGAAGPSIAVLPRDPTVGRNSSEALAAWRASAWNASGPAPVEVLGVWREQLNVTSETVRFVNGAGDGVPLRLPDETSSAHVGLASYALGASAGYVVAFARSGGGVSVSTLPHLAAVAPTCGPNAICAGTSPPASCGVDCTASACSAGFHCDPGSHQCAADCSASVPCQYGTCDLASGTCSGGVCITTAAGADNILGTADDGNPTTSIPRLTPQPSRSAPAMGTPTTSTLDSTTTVAGDVSVAVGLPAASDPPSSTLPLVLAWATSAEIVIARASLDPATHALTDGDRLRITSANARDVRVVHVEAGVSLAGQFAGGTIGATEVGGFVVTWTTSGGTFAARLSDHTGDLVAPGAVRLGDQADAPLAFVDYDDMGGSPRVRVAAHQGDAIVVYPSVCGPPAP